MPRPWAEARLLRMLETVQHESFYVSGTWIDESLGVYAGWVARKGSFADSMPVQNERKDVTLIFSGEDYPAQDTRANLKQRGHDFEQNGPSYLVHVYEDDPAFPVSLNGQFHGLVLDRARQTATLF